MQRYDLDTVLRRLGLVCGLLAMLVAPGVAEQGNPDGPVGSVAFEPSFKFGGVSGFDEQLSRWGELDLRKHHDDDEGEGPGGVEGWLLPATLVPRDVESRWETYGLSVFMPASRAWTLGASYRYTNVDTHDTRWAVSKTTTQVNTWEFGLRARYWFNLPE